MNMGFFWGVDQDQIADAKKNFWRCCCWTYYDMILGYPTGYSQHNTPNKW